MIIFIFINLLLILLKFKIIYLYSIMSIINFQLMGLLNNINNNKFIYININFINFIFNNIIKFYLIKKNI